ncbi:MAG: hypothetical protein OXH51_06405, partial [Gemmatimonadetes bacterium]|nr:hypothetical protein [Gemmatimonadota bacterium]
HEGPNRMTGIDLDNDGDIDMTFTQVHNPDNPVDYTQDQVVTKREDELTSDDFRNDDNDNDNDRGGGGCFLATAVIQLRGEADDGPTLTTLRQFRDGWLAETEEGRALISEYYLLAPGIVSAIPAGHAEWPWIAGQVDAARFAILAGLNGRALSIYSGMIRQLQERWL